MDKYRIGKALKNLRRHNLIVMNRGAKKSEVPDVEQYKLKKLKKKHGNSLSSDDLAGYNPKVRFITLTPEGRFFAEILKNGD